MYKFSSSNVKIDVCFVLDLQTFYPSEADANVVERVRRSHSDKFNLARRLTFRDLNWH